MKSKLTLILSLAALTASLQSNAQLFVIEPDDYPNGAILNHLLPQVSLVTAGANNLPIPFDVAAAYDGFGYASTGTNVFGHAGGIPFWNTNRRLRMDFTTPISLLWIEFIGGDLFTNDVAKLDAFSSAGTLLESYTSAPQPPDRVEPLFISRPASDIAWAVAYLPADGGSFGRLDNLRFSLVPEPSVIVISGLGGLLWMCRLRDRRRQGGRGI